jgi:hypothetical protein
MLAPIPGDSVALSGYDFRRNVWVWCAKTIRAIPKGIRQRQDSLADRDSGNTRSDEMGCFQCVIEYITKLIPNRNASTEGFSGYAR